MNELVMKSLLILGILLLIVSCASTEKTTGEFFRKALTGQDQTQIQSMLGTPTQILPSSGGGKIIVYEHKIKGMFLTPYKSRITYSPRKNVLGNREGFTFSSGVNTSTNAPEYTIYQEYVVSLKIFLDKKGIFLRYEEDLTKEIKEFYRNRFRQKGAKNGNSKADSI